MLDKVKLKPFQTVFLKSRKRFPAMIGGVGCGKTMMLLLKAWLYCEQYPETLGLIVRKSYSDLRDCFDYKTDILTNRGWQKFEDLKADDKVLSTNGKESFYQPITRIIKQDYEGEMYELDTCSRSFCVTPNHKMYVKLPNNKKDWHFKEIRNLYQKEILLKKTLNWEGKEQKTIEIGKETFFMDDWLEFLGWFVSEGNTYHHKTAKTWWINISQSIEKNPKNVAQIKNLFKRMEIKAGLYSNNKFVFGRADIAKHLNEHCGQGANNKKVPSYLKVLSPRQIKIFLDSYNKGDGYVLKDGSRRFNTVSKQLADDVQELILKTGKSASISIRDNRGRTTWIQDHWATTNYLDYLIIEHKRTTLKYNTDELTKIDYKGKIYCVETPYHTIFVRRNGKCMWSGNSTIQDFRKYFGVNIDAQEKSYEFKNGSKIMFRHGTVADISNLKNINLSFAFIEQAEEYENDEVFTFLRDRLRRQNAPYRQLGLIANARGHNWVWQRWVNNAAKTKTLDQKTGQVIYVNKEFVATTANSFANEDVLPKDFTADLKAMEKDSPKHYAQFVLNSFEDLEEDDLLFDFDEMHLSQDIRFFKYAQVSRVMAVDIARYGGDSTVATIIESRGVNKWEQIYIEDWSKKDLMHTTGRILDIYKRMKCNLLVIDGDGMGAGVVDRIKEQGRELVEFRGGRKAKKEKHYKNRRAEGYMLLKEKISKEMLKIKDHPRQTQDLLSIRYSFNSRGKREIVSKENMRKEGIKSPDYADTLMMAIAECDRTERASFNKHLPRFADSEAQLI